jgi:hypothetical protein
MSPGVTRRLQVFTVYRAVGVETRAQIWYRSRTPEERLAQSIVSRSAVVPAVAPAGTNATLFAEGGWERVLYDGTVHTMNAMEFAYEANLDDAGYDKIVEEQRRLFD